MKKFKTKSIIEINQISAIILFFLLIVASSETYSQKNQNTTKLSIGLKTYTPIYLTGSDKFYNDNWILDSPQKRTYYKYAFGLDIKYYFNENISLKAWGGISNRSLKESSYNEFYNNCMGCGGELEKNSESFEYKQTSYNGNIGINFSENIKKFEINTGVELAYLYTGKGRQTYHLWWMEYEDVMLPDSNDTYSKTTISSGNSFGLGIYIGAEYNINKHFSIGTEFHQFMFYSIFTNKTINESKSYARNLGTLTSESAATTETKDNFRQFAFSTILPVLDIRFKF